MQGYLSYLSSNFSIGLQYFVVKKNQRDAYTLVELDNSALPTITWQLNVGWAEQFFRTEFLIATISFLRI